VTSPLVVREAVGLGVRTGKRGTIRSIVPSRSRFDCGRSSARDRRILPL